MQKSINELAELHANGTTLLIWNFRWSYLDPFQRNEFHVGTLADLIQNIKQYEETDVLADSEFQDLGTWFANLVNQRTAGKLPTLPTIILEYAPHGEDDPKQGHSYIEVAYNERLNGDDLAR